MINDLLKYGFNFIVLVIIQILIINNIPISPYINPFIYISFIITLPIIIPGWILLLLGFILGLVIDISCSTPGMHTSATLSMAFIRPYLLSSIIPRDDYQPNAQPAPDTFGLAWFIKYAIIMVLVHHIFLFFIEEFSFQSFFATILKIILSSLFSLLLIMIVQMFKFNQSKVR